MNYSVFKHQSALTDLINAWNLGDDRIRAGITSAMLDLEKQLQQSPDTQGESRDGQTRVLFRYPIAVTYEIDEAKRLVRILRAWTFRRLAA